MLPKIFKPYKSLRKNLVRIGPRTDGGYVIDKRVIKKSNTIIIKKYLFFISLEKTYTASNCNQNS